MVPWRAVPKGDHACEHDMIFHCAQRDPTLNMGAERIPSSGVRPNGSIARQAHSACLASMTVASPASTGSIPKTGDQFK